MSWPGITVRGNWSCAKEIVVKSQRERTDFRAVMAVSPKYLLKNKQTKLEKIRVVADACFR